MKQLLIRLKNIGFVPKNTINKYTFEAITISERILDSEKLLLLGEIQNWLRETFELYIVAIPTLDDNDDNLSWIGTVYLINPYYWKEFLKEDACIIYSTYEEALINGIEDCVKIIEILNKRNENKCQFIN